MIQINLTCPTCGKIITDARPAQGGSTPTYVTGDGHIIRFDKGTVEVSRCPQTETRK